MTKTYFFPDDYTEFDIFGQEMPVCIDRAEVSGWLESMK